MQRGGFVLIRFFCSREAERFAFQAAFATWPAQGREQSPGHGDRVAAFPLPPPGKMLPPCSVPSAGTGAFAPLSASAKPAAKRPPGGGRVPSSWDRAQSVRLVIWFTNGTFAGFPPSISISTPSHLCFPCGKPPVRSKSRQTPAFARWFW